MKVHQNNDTTQLADTTMPKALPDREELLRVFRIVDDNSGLVWNVTPGGGPKIGDVAGTKKSHGWQVKYHTHLYYVHRIIWKMVHDEEPLEIDHKDTNDYNNRLSNLRPADHSTNQMNTRTRKDNNLGARGVFYSNGRYHAQVYVAGKRVSYTHHDTLQEAVDARNKQAAIYHGEFCRRIG